jgi:hypothetical protein
MEPDTISELIKLNELNAKTLAQANPISVPVSRKLMLICFLLSRYWIVITLVGSMSGCRVNVGSCRITVMLIGRELHRFVGLSGMSVGLSG